LGGHGSTQLGPFYLRATFHLRAILAGARKVLRNPLFIVFNNPFRHGKEELTKHG
jgi:hypothetical protein